MVTSASSGTGTDQEDAQSDNEENIHELSDADEEVGDDGTGSRLESERCTASCKHWMWPYKEDDHFRRCPRDWWGDPSALPDTLDVERDSVFPHHSTCSGAGVCKCACEC